MKTFYKYLETRIVPKLRRLSEEKLGHSTLTATDIYNFYWLFSALSYGQLAKDEVGLAQFYLKEIKDLYVSVFTELLTQQIEKYVSRGRIDMQQGQPAFDVSMIRKAPLQQRPGLIKSMMAKTFRSDMQRRNVVWDQIADHLYGLANAGNIDKICFFIDRINNSVHNTHTLVLDKLPMGQQLMQALDNAHKAAKPMQLAKYVSPEVRRLVKQWFGPGVQ